MAENIIVALIVLAVALWVFRRFYRIIKGKSGCGCGCGNKECPVLKNGKVGAESPCCGGSFSACNEAAADDCKKAGGKS